MTVRYKGRSKYDSQGELKRPMTVFEAMEYGATHIYAECTYRGCGRRREIDIRDISPFEFVPSVGKNFRCQNCGFKGWVMTWPKFPSVVSTKNIEEGIERYRAGLYVGKDNEKSAVK